MYVYYKHLANVKVMYACMHMHAHIHSHVRVYAFICFAFMCMRLINVHSCSRQSHGVNIHLSIHKSICVFGSSVNRLIIMIFNVCIK